MKKSVNGFDIYWPGGSASGVCFLGGGGVMVPHGFVGIKPERERKRERERERERERGGE